MKSSSKSKLLKLIALHPQIINWGPTLHSQGFLVPYYFNFRGAGALPKLRQTLVAELVKEIKKYKVDVIAGAESAGMGWAAMVADRLNKPYVYIRKSRKNFLDRRLVEGYFKPGARAVLIDDTILLGKTIKSMTMGAKQDKLQVTHILLLYTAQPSAAVYTTLWRWLKQQHIVMKALLSKLELSDLFIKQGVLTPEIVGLNNMYMIDPYGWHKSRRAQKSLPILRKYTRKFEHASV